MLSLFSPHLRLTISITGIMDGVCLQNIVQLSAANLLVFASEQLVSGKVPVKILLDVVGVARVRT